MSIYLQVTGTRVLTPAEITQLTSAMVKPTSRLLFDVLLYTGMRYSELFQIYEEPGRFDPDRLAIEIKNTKSLVARVTPVRYVILSPAGAEAVRKWIESGRKPPRITQWRKNLLHWAHVSGLQPAPGKVDLATWEDDRNEAIENVWDLSARTTRKTWECYLLATFPHLTPSVLRSQGHSTEVSEKHYVKVCDLFTPAEMSEIRKITTGWSGIPGVKQSAQMKATLLRIPARPSLF